MTVRVAFLGYRFMGRAHANALARLPQFFPDAPDVERYALVGTDESAVAAAADRLGFAETTTDWRDVVDRVDVLYNLAPNHLHVEPSIAALESDTAVLCEKPLAATLDGAERMADAVRRSDATAGVAFNYRFLPAIQAAKARIEAGDIGDVRQFRGHYLQDWLVDDDAPWTWRNDADRAGTGALGDLGAHLVDLARFLVGEVDHVSGHLRTFVDERSVEGSEEARPVDGEERTRPVTTDDAFSMQAAFADGAMGTFEGSRVAPGHKNDQTIAIHGTDGSLRFSLERLNELEVLAGDARGYETVLVTEESDPYGDAWWPPGHVLGWEHAVVHENAEFLASVAGDGAFHPSFADGLAVQRVLDAVERGDDEGAWVSV